MTTALPIARGTSKPSEVVRSKRNQCTRLVPIGPPGTIATRAGNPVANGQNDRLSASP